MHQNKDDPEFFLNLIEMLNEAGNQVKIIGESEMSI